MLLSRPAHERFGLVLGVLLIVVLAQWLGPLVGEAAPMQQFTPASTVRLEMYVLVESGPGRGARQVPVESCTQTAASRQRFGCTAYPGQPSYAYPYAQSISATVAIETDYLLDVIASEMSPAVYGEAIATRAQAIASRSFVHYYIGNPPQAGSPPDLPLNNSTKYQVFVPFSFEQLNRRWPALHLVRLD
ncbi:MAG: SpoIID/LytB domain-containing protein [Anaerolineales bacterium]|nr:SpoIID/LytB domain-containing protein [Anaerolineales bacterium]